MSSPDLFVIYIAAIMLTWRKSFDRPVCIFFTKNDFQLTGRRFNTVGSAFEVDDDTAILFETRDDLAVYSPLLITHFDKFGMEIHAGDYDNSNKPSKTEVLFVSKPPKSYTDPSTYDNADLTNIDILEIESFFQLLINSAILVGS